ncbi:hypothetical protein FACS1894159_07730 [Bacteroidia bacterium]|nr:hypothetical protein FACS1894159_07730 [Bacteroidia bacterium]
MISANPENIQIGIEAQSILVQVRSNVHWTAAVTQGNTWCALSQSQGYGTESIYINVLEYNDGATPRVAIIQLNTTGANQASAQIMVVQSADNSTLMISPSAVEIDKAAQTVGLAIASNDDWIISADKPSLVTINPTSGNGNATIDIDVLENNDHDNRVITLTVTAGQGSRTVQKTATITQKGVGAPTLFLSETSLSFPAIGINPGDLTANIVAVTNIAGPLQASSDFAWCTPTVDPATNIITVAVSQNDDNAPRYAIVTVIGNVNGTAVSSQIRVTQAGVGSPIITLLTSSVQVDHAAQNASASFVKTNSGITVAAAGYPSWISNVQIASSPGSIVGTVTFDVSENVEMAMRQGVISLVASLGSESIAYPINVLQSGVGAIQLTLIPTVVNAVAGGEPIAVTGFVSEPTATVEAIVANGPSSMISGGLSTSSPTGITVDPTTGSLVIPFNVDPNPDYGTRTATIVVTASKGSQVVMSTISVIQAGIGAPNIIVVSDAITIPQAGASAGANYGTQILGATAATSFNIVTVNGFTAVPLNSPVDFIAISKPTANNTTAAITQQITMVASQGGATQAFVLTITQPGLGSPKLTIPTTSFTYPAAGLTTTDIVVIPDGATAYSVVAKPAWISAAIVNPNTLTITVDPNTTSSTLYGTITLLADNGSGAPVVYTIGVTQEGVAGPNLSLAATDIYVTANQTSVSIPIIGDLAGVTSTTYVPNGWITSAVETSGSLDITLQANLVSDTRSQEVSLIATRAGQSQTLKVKITQAGVGTPNVVPGATALQFGPVGETGINVYLMNEGATAADHAAVTIKSKPSWVSNESISADNDLLTFDVANNNTTQTRSGVIVLEATKGGKKAMISITVTQAALAPLNASLSTYSITVGAAATTGLDQTNVLIMNLGTGVVTPTIHSSNAWLSGAVSGNELSVTVTSNNYGISRTGVLTLEIIDSVTSEVQYLTLVVNQADQNTIVIGDLLLSTAGVTIPIAGTAQSVGLLNYVAADYLSINASTSASWITVTPQTGITAPFDISATANTGIERTGTVSVLVTKSNGQQQTITVGVTQEGVAPVADLVPAALGVNFVATSASPISVALNTYNPADYPSILTSISAGWITANFNNGAIEISATDNTAPASRSGSVTVTVSKGDGTTQTITISVTQVGVAPIPDIVPQSTSVNLVAEAGSATANYIPVAAYPFDATLYNSFSVTPSQSWIYAQPGTGNTMLIIWADANTLVTPRSGFITLDIGKTDGTTQTVIANVTQAGATPIPDVIIPVAGVTLTDSGAGLTQVFNFNIDLTQISSIDITRGDTWFTATGTGGASDYQVDITATDNTSASPRSSYVDLIIAKANGTTQTARITVKQLGNVPTVPPTPLADLVPDYTGVNLPETTATAANVTLQGFTSAADYTVAVTNSASWITVDANSAPGTVAINSTSNNLAATSRTGNVKLTISKATGGTQTIVIDVVQEGTVPTVVGVTPDLVPPVNGVNLNDAGNPVVINMTNSFDPALYTNLQITSGAWFTVDNTSVPPTSYSLTVSADANTSISSRTGTFTLTVTKVDGSTQIINGTVTQAGAAPVAPSTPIPDLIIPVAGVTLTDSGSGLTQVFNFTIDLAQISSIDITRGDTWFNATGTGGGSSYQVDITATDNTSASSRSSYVDLIIAKADGTTQTARITVTQAGATPAVPTADLVSASSGVNFIATSALQATVALNTYTSTADYPSIITTASAGWITAAFNAGVIEIDAADNTSTASRTGTVTVRVNKSVGAQQVITINVTQAGATPQTIANLVPDYSGVMIANTPAGDVAVTLQGYTSATDYPSIVKSISAPWITATINAGTVGINANSVNSTSSTRTGTVTLIVNKSNGTTQNIVINVEQE